MSDSEVPFTDVHQLDDEQLATVDALHKSLQARLRLAVEKNFVTPACCRRYLVANKWKVEEATKKILSTIKWRHEFGVDDMLSHLPTIMDHSGTGKMYVNGCDKFGHPILYMHNARNEKRFLSDHEGSLRHLVYEMERAISLMPEGIEKMCICMDFRGYSVFNAPPMKTSRATLDILSNHYPERMASSLMYSPPFAFWLFWKVISPFIDPVTKTKVHMISGNDKSKNTELQTHIDVAECLSDFGGDNQYSFLEDGTRESYWAACTVKGELYNTLYEIAEPYVTEEKNNEKGEHKEEEKSKSESDDTKQEDAEVDWEAEYGLSWETRLASEVSYTTYHIVNRIGEFLGKVE